MKIGIIVYSRTGKTLSVATKLRDRLSAVGHSVDMERLVVAGEDRMGVQVVQLESIPDVGKYEAVVFATPVQGGAPSPAMRSYLAEVASLEGKKVACLVTEGFPFPWMGGNQTIRKMVGTCESKGAAICGTGIVNWTSLRRARKITVVVDRLSMVFGG